MTEPSVCAVCLYADRPQFVARMLASFRSQTYQNKRLLIYDNGVEPFDSERFPLQPREVLVREVSTEKRSIGALRNAANDLVVTAIIAHGDVDDWGHPGRLAEQVALLRNFDGAVYSPYDAVGYREMLFWDTTPGQFCSSWLYTNNDPKYILGTSLMYWRATWERKPFADKNVGEDLEFIRGLNTLGVSSLSDDPPRMIASVHGGNTVKNAIVPESSNWRRTPEWDDCCRRLIGHGQPTAVALIITEK